MAQRYEQLRSDATTGCKISQGWGLALFCRRGMAAWMRAWSACTATSKVADKQVAGNNKDNLLTDVRDNMIMMLVNMALSREGKYNGRGCSEGECISPKT